MDNVKVNHILKCHSSLNIDIIKGENATLLNNDNKEFIDFESGDWAAILGHCNPKINTCIKNQIEKIIHLPTEFISNLAEDLSIKLLKLLNMSNGKSIFLNSGSEAVEMSIRLATLISNKKRLLTFTHSYLSAYSTGAIPRDKKIWTEINFLKCNNCDKKQYCSNCAFLSTIDFNDISAFIFEPGSSCGRVILPPYKLVKFITQEVKKTNGLLVINEVTTGFGRTGKWFGYNHYDIQPDIVALGKCLGNGYPISAVVMKEEVAAKVELQKFSYAQSHQNDPLGCAIANEVIKIFEEDDMISQGYENGALLFNELTKLKELYPIIKEVRGLGLMISLELNNYSSNVAKEIRDKLLERGYFVGLISSLNTLRFFPPITISKNHIENLCLTLNDILNENKGAI